MVRDDVAVDVGLGGQQGRNRDDEADRLDVAEPFLMSEVSGSLAIVSPRHRPEVNQPDRLDPGRLHLVEFADAVGFGAEFVSSAASRLSQ